VEQPGRLSNRLEEDFELISSLEVGVKLLFLHHDYSPHPCLSAFFKIRLMQAQRVLNDAGLFGFLLAGLGSAALLKWTHGRLDTPQASLYIFLFALVGVLHLHRNRKDRIFLSSIKKSPWAIFYLEYILLLLPLCVVYFFSSYWYMYSFSNQQPSLPNSFSGSLHLFPFGFTSGYTG